jgi:hypothetical protein
MTNTLAPEQRHARGRLWRVELDSLPERAVREALEHLARWAVPLSAGALGLPRVDDARYTDLALTISDIVAYARTGNAADWDDTSSAEDAFNDISILYDTLLGDSVTPADWLDDAEREGVRGELAEVARAVLARVRIAQGEPVPRQWLAALAGVQLLTVVRAIKDRKLAIAAPRKRARGAKAARDVTAASARAWLIERGVEGV